MSRLAPKVNELSWMIGGPQGSGVDSSANAFTRACAHGGLNVFGKREYYSNIMGRHSYFSLRASRGTVRSHIDDVELLTTFDAETVFRHTTEVVDGGAVIFDPALAGTKVSDVDTISRRNAAEIRAQLAALGLGETLGDALAAAEKRGILLVPIPFKELLETIAAEFTIDALSKISRVVNMLAVGASFGLLKYDFVFVEKAISGVFRGKEKLVRMNAWGARKAYDLARERVPEFPIRLERIPRKEPRLILTGSQATALGKLYGGMRFQTYYPITPASDESEYLEANPILDLEPEAMDAAFAKERDGSILVVQTEDEIAAVTMASGAALTGTRAATATSGPGFSLMMEGIGWASINEVPVVITLYQRAGPSTGMPTRHEAGDLRFALHAGHGESPRILLASGDFEECIRDGALCFNYADRYQTPVIHIVDKALANSNGTIPVPDLSDLKIDRGALVNDGSAFTPENPYKRFDLSKGPISPRASIGQPGTLFWNTGDEHDELGHITEDPTLRNLMMEKRDAKLELAAKEIPDEVKLAYFGPEDADTVLVSWGSTKGAILDALERLGAEGVRVGYLHIRLLNPFPVDAVTSRLAKAERIVDVEMNFGAQLAGLIRERTGIAVTHRVVKYNGRPISSQELHEALTRILRGKAEPRTVLTRGA